MASVKQPKNCGCKGVRSCLVCENTDIVNGVVSGNGLTPVHPWNCSRPTSQEGKEEYVFCIQCNKASKKYDDEQHPNHTGESLQFPGILLVEDFITEAEESLLASTIDRTPWTNSQSGRRKQDYGPKVNFKKKKLRLDCFSGLPSYSKELVHRFKQNHLLKDFVPVELCNLEYVNDRGSAIDPHFDDFWLWGERLITLNMLSDTYLTMSKDSSPNVVHVPMPRRSLIVVHGPARYEWKHAVLRQNITSRRLATTFRELTPEFLKDGDKEELGTLVTEIALSYEGEAVGCSS